MWSRGTAGPLRAGEPLLAYLSDPGRGSALKLTMTR